MKLDYSAVKSATRKLKFRTQAFIDGKFVNAQSGKTFTTENPATGQPLAQVAACDTPDIDCAVTAARRAFEAGTWSRMKPADRTGHRDRHAAVIRQLTATIRLAGFVLPSRWHVRKSIPLCVSVMELKRLNRGISHTWGIRYLGAARIIGPIGKAFEGKPNKNRL